MNRVTKDGITYTAAANAPSLPVAVGNSVHAIIGLQPFRHANKHFRRYMAGTEIAPSPNALPINKASSEVRNKPPYLVKEILNAYRANELSVTGKGQTIGILIDTFPVDADLIKFWETNKIDSAISRIEKINVKNSSLPSAEGEETLDAEWTSGIAPGAKVKIYASGSLQFVDLNMALDRIIVDTAIDPGLRQISVSLGLGETFMGGPQGVVAVQHQKFLRLAAVGVNVFQVEMRVQIPTQLVIVLQDHYKLNMNLQTPSL
jgi:kumamolisin